eukprot:6199844-Pleurochrysis_carterae.AAC.9
MSVTVALPAPAPVPGPVPVNSCVRARARARARVAHVYARGCFEETVVPFAASCPLATQFRRAIVAAGGYTWRFDTLDGCNPTMASNCIISRQIAFTGASIGLCPCSSLSLSQPLARPLSRVLALSRFPLHPSPSSSCTPCLPTCVTCRAADRPTCIPAAYQPTRLACVPLSSMDTVQLDSTRSYSPQASRASPLNPRFCSFSLFPTSERLRSRPLLPPHDQPLHEFL